MPGRNAPERSRTKPAMAYSGDQALHHLQHRLVERRSRRLALAGPLAIVQGRQRAQAAVGGRQAVADGDAHARRRPVRLADDGAPAAHGLADAAEAGALGVGPVLAEAGHAHHDQAGVSRRRSRAPGPSLPACPGGSSRSGCRPWRSAAAPAPGPRPAQVERHRLLVARDHLPPDRRAAGPRPRMGSPAPGGSILITSAPMSPSSWPQNGPAISVAHLDHPQVLERAAVFGSERGQHASSPGTQAYIAQAHAISPKRRRAARRRRRPAAPERRWFWQRDAEAANEARSADWRYELIRPSTEACDVSTRNRPRRLHLPGR